uniref:Uncharacterized protein n=1 Tax=Arundo donax TaxID=35708 RepID=A0A0A9GMM4_ARUDO
MQLRTPHTIWQVELWICRRMLPCCLPDGTETLSEAHDQVANLQNVLAGRAICRMDQGFEIGWTRKLIPS